MELVVCTVCLRHVFAEAACPFCADGAPSERVRGRALTALIGASLIGVACTGTPTPPDAAPATPTPVVVPVPPYGVPPIPEPPTPTPTPVPTPTPTPATTDAGVRRPPAVPAYGMPPQRRSPRSPDDPL